MGHRKQRVAGKMWIIATRSAPACCPKTARATQAQTPRSVAASRLLTPALMPFEVNTATEQPGACVLRSRGIVLENHDLVRRSSRTGAAPLVEMVTMELPLLNGSLTPMKFLRTVNRRGRRWRP